MGTYAKTKGTFSVTESRMAGVTSGGNESWTDTARINTCRGYSNAFYS